MVKYVYCIAFLLYISLLTEKLTTNHAIMDADVFKRLPTSTNAVESHNRFSKCEQTQDLKVGMMIMYQEDMSKTLEFIALSEGMRIL